MSYAGSILLQIAPWVKTILVVVLLLLALAQVLRLAPPIRRREKREAVTDQLAGLLGETGRVLTPLRPVGLCEFDGCRVECAAEGEYVQAGATVRVIRVEGMQPTVRAIDEV
ncbi:MAG: NfeD family protein [Phycisphaerales bacterium]|nr:MAG: NfeD family protein [Phycisphaerales bacterium]